MPTYFIHITGQVQGIGFRPFIYRLATQLRLDGWVSNRADGVHIKVTGGEPTVREFFDRLSREAPALSRIQNKQIREVEEEALEGFRIVQELSGTASNLLLTPDLALCAACRREIKNPRSRRYGYAFTTCTRCGPRYSILAKLPYDRPHTAMAAFALCHRCTREYHDPGDRRYYAQTLSCPGCPVTLRLYEAGKGLVSADQQHIIPAAVNILREGKIVAVKGIGGFLLLADATNGPAISTLRARKHRPAKPFALMYPDIKTAEQDVCLSKAEQRLLLSPPAPVVLALKKEPAASGIQAALIAPRLQKLGVMLPYTPLFELLLSLFAKPVVATSANVSGSHLVFRNEEALEQLAGIADFMLVHDRDILMAQDDSVVQLSPVHQQKILLRRARGYAPSLAVEGRILSGEHRLLALGADMKSSFAFTASGNTYVSQFLGDLSAYDNLLHFEQSLHRLTHLLDFRPSLVVTDKHPGYASARLGRALARDLGIPCVGVQHHEAHFAAVLAENGLLEDPEPVLGVIWDGTGFGNDGLVRGGEFLLLQQGAIRRVAQLEPFPHILADKMAGEPRISALAICHRVEGAEKLLRTYFTEVEWKLYHRLLSAQMQLPSTSMGRVFDAAAALLGLCGRNSYEGEAAMGLEAVASQYKGIFSEPGYLVEGYDGPNIPLGSLFQQLIADIGKGVGPERIAAKFHVTWVNAIQLVARCFSVNRIAFSGGVFQNSLLADLVWEKLHPQFHLYFHRQLPPNDECISFGQLSWVRMQERAGGEQNQPSFEKGFLVNPS